MPTAQPQPLPRSYLRARAKAARCPTQHNRAARTAALARMLPAKAAKALRGEAKSREVTHG